MDSGHILRTVSLLQAVWLTLSHWILTGALKSNCHSPHVAEEFSEMLTHGIFLKTCTGSSFLVIFCPPKIYLVIPSSWTMTDRAQNKMKNEKDALGTQYMPFFLLRHLLCVHSSPVMWYLLYSQTAKGHLISTSLPSQTHQQEAGS